MEQTVYGDLLFFVNFCMDFQCLFLTARLLRRPFRVWRGLVFAALGALYACAALFIEASGGVAFLCDLFVCFLMCAGVFAGTGRGILRLLIPFGLYFGVSMAVGGVMSAMATLLSKIDLPLSPGTGEDSSPAFFLLAALGGLATLLWGRLCQQRARGREVTLTLTLEGRELSVRGMVDTANLLCDPIGGRPVAILDRRTATAWLPPGLSGALRDATSVSALPPTLARRVRLIPTETVTGQGLLLAILPDTAVLDTGSGPRAVELLIAPAPLHGTAGDCKLLLPPTLLTE